MITIVNEYLALEAQERQRSLLKASSPIALSIYKALDSHAGIRDDGLQRLVGGRLETRHQTGHETSINAGVQALTSVQLLDEQVKGDSSAAGAELDETKTTPRRTLARKGTPRKRKRLELSAKADTLGSPTNWNGEYHPLDLPEDLRDCQMNLEGLEELLVDSTKQNQFAQGLLHLLNQQQPESADLNMTKEPSLHEEDFEWLFSLAEPTKNKPPALPVADGQAMEAGNAASGYSRQLFLDLEPPLNRDSAQNPNESIIQHKRSVEEREIPEEIAAFMSRPEDFADVIEACIR